MARKSLNIFGCFAGLDISLAGTAGVLLDTHGAIVSTLAFTTSKREAQAGKHGRTKIILSPEVKLGDAHSMWARTVFVAAQVSDWLCEWAEPGALVGVEDHAFGAKGTSIYQLGHLHGLIRRDLQHASHPWLLIAPTELKAAVTGKGNADKDAMMATPTPGLDQEAFGRATRNNVVDAYWLAHLARAYDLARSDEWDEISDTMAKVLRPHSKRAGLMARKKLP